MEITIDFPGSARVDAHLGPYTIHTDQPPQAGGQASAPTPFETFLAAIGACTGIYVLNFCRQRGIETDGLRLFQRLDVDPATGHVSKIRIAIRLPPNFPAKYQSAVVRAAQHCTVKKHLETPQFEIDTVADPMPAWTA